MIVEFDHPLEQPNSIIGKIEKILEGEIQPPNKSFKLKRLAFGFGDVSAPQAMTLEGVDNADFIIERRTGAPYSTNRYFCSAPLKIADHLRVLELIERAASHQKLRSI